MSFLLLRTWLTVVSADTYTLSVQCGHEDVVLVIFFLFDAAGISLGVCLCSGVLPVLASERDVFFDARRC